MTMLTDQLLASFDEMTQKGLNSHLAPRGRYSWQEETLVQFNRWLVRRYRGHWPSNGS